MANHTTPEGGFPEPTSIPEYQAELLRVWGALLRLDTKVKKMGDDAKEMREQAERVYLSATELAKIIQSVTK